MMSYSEEEKQLPPASPSLGDTKSPASDLIIGKGLENLKTDQYRRKSRASRREYSSCCRVVFRMDENIIWSLPWSNLQNARHVSFLCNGNNFTWPLHLFHKCCRLRTFILLPSESGSHVDHQIPCDLFLSLCRMRVLNLSYTNIIELPDSIGTLKHLRYLNVSSTHIEKLPESVTNLYGLETLKLKNCFNLLQLPKYMRNLSNLRHLELDIKHQLSYMPLEFGKLTNLQTLSAFIVGKEPGQLIEELKNMNSLHGSICITNLENVVSVNEAEFANLDKKPYLDKLELQWNEINIASAEQVLAGLRPHYKIKELTISSYGGIMFPSWLSDASFDKLENIYLQNCRYCRYLPELDKLPSLRWIYIHEKHDLELLEVSRGFPSLQSLKLHDMVNLQQFLLLPSAMLNLRELTIVDCPNLRYLPQLYHLSQLEYLKISRCPQLQFSPTEELPSSLKLRTAIF